VLILVVSGAAAGKLNVTGGQHDCRDVTKALLLPSLHRSKSIDTKWPQPGPKTRSVRRYGIIVPAYAYCSPVPLVHKNSNKQFCNLISCTAEVLAPLFF
jgi:hypothetical protein